MKKNKTLLVTALCATTAICLIGCGKEIEEVPETTEVIQTETPTMPIETTEETRPKVQMDNWLEKYKETVESDDIVAAILLSELDKNTGIESPAYSSKNYVDKKGNIYNKENVYDTVIEEISLKDKANQYHTFSKTGGKDWEKKTIFDVKYEQMPISYLINNMNLNNNILSLPILDDKSIAAEFIVQEEPVQFLNKECAVVKGTFKFENIKDDLGKETAAINVDGTVTYEIYFDLKDEKLLGEKLILETENDVGSMTCTKTYSKKTLVEIPDIIKNKDVFEEAEYNKQRIRIDLDSKEYPSLKITTKQNFGFNSTLQCPTIYNNDEFYAYVIGYTPEGSMSKFLKEQSPNFIKLQDLEKENVEASLYAIKGETDMMMNDTEAGYMIFYRNEDAPVGVVISGANKENLLKVFEGLKIINKFDDSEDELFPIIDNSDRITLYQKKEQEEIKKTDEMISEEEKEQENKSENSTDTPDANSSKEQTPEEETEKSKDIKENSEDEDQEERESTNHKLSIHDYVQKYIDMQSINNYDITAKEQLQAKVDGDGHIRESGIIRFGKDPLNKSFIMQESGKELRTEISFLNTTNSQVYCLINDVNNKDENSMWQVTEGSDFNTKNVSFLEHMAPIPSKYGCDSLKDALEDEEQLVKDFKVSKEPVKFNNINCYEMKFKRPLNETRMMFTANMSQVCASNYLKGQKDSLVDMYVYFDAVTNEYVGEKRIFENPDLILTTTLAYSPLENISIPESIEIEPNRNWKQNKLYEKEKSWYSEESEYSVKLSKNKLIRNPLLNNYLVVNDDDVIGYLYMGESAAEFGTQVSIILNDVEETKTITEGVWTICKGPIQTLNSFNKDENKKGELVGYAALYSSENHENVIICSKDKADLDIIMDDIKVYNK